MTNVSTGNMNSSTKSDIFGPLVSFSRFTILLLSVIIIFCEIVAVFVLQRCKRMTPCSRIISTSFIVSDALGAFIFAVHQIAILGFGINNAVIHNSRVLSVGTMFSVSCASVASLALERVAALKINIKYNLNASKLKVSLLVSFIWIVNILTVAVAILSGLFYHCDSTWATCDFWKVSKAARLVIVSLLVFYEIVLIVSYLIMHKIASRHARDIATTPNEATLTSRQYAATKTIIKIVLAFMLLHAPIIIHFVVFETQIAFRNKTLRRVLHAFSYMCIQCNSFVSLRFYVAKFDECKLYFYLILSSMFKSYEKHAEELRISVYDIVLSKDVDNVRKQSKPPAKECSCTSINGNSEGLVEISV